jgi:hypothetical protein
LARLPPADRFAMMQHHADHRTTRPLLAVRRARLRPLHQALTVQMQLRNRVAQRVVVPFGQLFVEMFHCEATVEITIQTQHPFDLSHRRTAQGRSQTTVVQT